MKIPGCALTGAARNFFGIFRQPTGKSALKIWLHHNKIVILPAKETNTFNYMTYEAIQYSSGSEALEAFRKMIARKKQWVEKTEKEFEQIAIYRQQINKA